MNTESNNRTVSQRGIERILRKNLNGSISKQSVEFLQLYFEELIQQQLRLICGNVIIRQEELNTLRMFHGLPEKKRFDLSIFLNGVGEIFNPSSDWKVEGEVGKLKNTTLSKYKADEEVA